jgi:hypothetical protein
MNAFRTFFRLAVMTGFFGTLYCGSSIKNAQDFSPNQAPVIETGGILLTDTSGNAYTREAVIVGLKVRCTVTAHDPEKKTLLYSFDSSYGSISNQTVTDTGCTVDFLLERINQNYPIILNLTVSDDKNASASAAIDIGTGQTGVILTVNSPLKGYLPKNSTTEFTFEATGTGWYQVLESSADITDIESSMSIIQKYAAAGDLVTTTIAESGYAGKFDYKTLQLSVGNGVKKIWVLFKDGNNYYSAGTTSVTVDTVNPAVISITPDAGTNANVPSQVVTVTFTQSVDENTLASALLLSGGYYDSIAYQSYDSTAFTATYIVSGLMYNSDFYGAVSGVTDYAGNPAPDKSFTFSTPEITSWGQSAISCPADSGFASVVSDGKGSVYAAGYILGTGEFDFGNSVTATGTSSLQNIVLVKYDSDGKALWARTVTTGTNVSWFNSVVVASDGSVYAAGYITGTDEFKFANIVTATGIYSAKNIVLVKYSSEGTAQWAKTVTSGSAASQFNSIAVSSDGVVYAAGSIDGNSEFKFGDKTVTGISSGKNIVLVKYNSDGDAQWANSVASATNSSVFNSVAVGSDGVVYAAGYINETESFGFGNSVAAAGKNSGNNIVLVKYNNEGKAQWAKTVASGSAASQFNSVAIGSDGSVYSAGFIYGAGEFNFGNSVTAAGAYSSGNNIVLVKYNNEGKALWAKSVTSGSNQSTFKSISTDGNGNVFAAGNIKGSAAFNFGNSVDATGIKSTNIVLVKYNNAGTAQWAKTILSGSCISEYAAVAADRTGIYAAGYISGTDSSAANIASFFEGISVTILNTHPNPLLVKY